MSRRQVGRSSGTPPGCGSFFGCFPGGVRCARTLATFWQPSGLAGQGRKGAKFFGGCWIKGMGSRPCRPQDRGQVHPARWNGLRNSGPLGFRRECGTLDPGCLQATFRADSLTCHLRFLAEDTGPLASGHFSSPSWPARFAGASENLSRRRRSACSRLWSGPRPGGRSGRDTSRRFGRR